MILFWAISPAQAAVRVRDGVTDNLGSVVAVIDTAGNIAAQYSYDPYGSTVSASEG